MLLHSRPTSVIKILFPAQPRWSFRILLPQLVLPTNWNWQGREIWFVTPRLQNYFWKLGFNSPSSLNMNFVPQNLAVQHMQILSPPIDHKLLILCLLFHYMSRFCWQSWNRYCSQASSGQKGDVEGAEVWADGWRKQGQKGNLNSHQERQHKAVIRKRVPGVKSKERGKVTHGEARAQGPEGKGSESDCRVQVGTRQTIQN